MTNLEWELTESKRREAELQAWAAKNEGLMAAQDAAIEALAKKLRELKARVKTLEDAAARYNTLRLHVTSLSGGPNGFMNITFNATINAAEAWGLAFDKEVDELKQALAAKEPKA